MAAERSGARQRGFNPRRGGQMAAPATAPNKRFQAEARRHGRKDAKRQVYKVCVVSVLLYGCETWVLTEEMFRKLEVFHNHCVRVMGVGRFCQAHRCIRSAVPGRSAGARSLGTLCPACRGSVASSGLAWLGALPPAMHLTDHMGGKTCCSLAVCAQFVQRKVILAYCGHMTAQGTHPPLSGAGLGGRHGAWLPPWLAKADFR